MVLFLIPLLLLGGQTGGESMGTKITRMVEAGQLEQSQMFTTSNAFGADIWRTNPRLSRKKRKVRR